jgi:hypothetical protein
VKTVLKKPGQYEGSPGAETFVVGKKKGAGKPAAAGSKVDELESLSRDDLSRLLQGAYISPHKKGSQPKDTRAGANGSDAGESSSSGKQHSAGSSSSSSSSSLSSGGGELQAKSLAQSE